MSADPPAPETVPFGARIMRAIAWRSGSQIVAQLIMWAATFFVIRLLDPRDYGLYAMTQSVLAFLTLLNGQEFAASLVQSKDVSRQQIRQTFGLLIAMNVAMAGAQWIIAPAAGVYYKHAEVTTMLRVQTLLYLATPLIALPNALLARELNYRTQATVNLGSALVGAGVSLGMALAGAGWWTLVAAPIATFWTRAIGLSIAARLLVLPSFDFRGAGAVMKFGGAMLLSSLFWLIQTQADVVIGGRLMRAHSLGLYTEALFLTQIVTAKFVPPLNDVAFSAYARMQDDRSGAARAFEKSVRLIMMIALPFYAGLAVTARPFVDVMLGEKWDEMVPIVQVLACVMPLVTLQILFAPATTALGHPRVQVIAAAVGAVVMPIGFLIGAPWGGIGLAWGWLAAFPVLAMVTARYAIPIIGTTARALWDAVLPSLLAAAGMAAMVVIVDHLIGPVAPLPRLTVLVTTGVVAYAALMMLVARGIVSEARALVQRRPAPQV